MKRSVFEQFNVIAPNVYGGARTTSTRRSPGEKDAQSIMDMLDKRSFDSHSIAYLLSTYPVELQKPLFDLAFSILNAMAAKKVNGLCDEAELDHCTAAEVVINIIIARLGS